FESIPGISAFTVSASLVSETSRFGIHSPAAAGNPLQSGSKNRSNSRSISRFRLGAPVHGIRVRIAFLLSFEVDTFDMCMLSATPVHRRIGRFVRLVVRPWGHGPPPRGSAAPFGRSPAPRVAHREALRLERLDRRPRIDGGETDHGLPKAGHRARH